MAAVATILSIATYAGLVHTIPPPQCFAKFNWNDCGKSPQPVLYYWQPGSRCEVGIWRGCLPNINMFKDEYECVSTCIFTVRAAEQDWHQINAMEEEQDITGNMTDYDDKGNGTAFGDSTSEYDNSTSVNSTEPDDSETVTVGGDSTDAAIGDDAIGDNAAGDTAAGDDTTVEGPSDDATPGEETTSAGSVGEPEGTTEEPDAETTLPG